MALTTNEVKLYCHVDSTEEDNLVESLMEAAEALLLEQTGKTTYIGNDGTGTTKIQETKLFQVAEKQLVSHWFDNRSAAARSTLSDIPFAVDMLIAHFKYSKEYS